MTRREFLTLAAAMAAASPPLFADESKPYALSKDDDAFLDRQQQACFRYFAERSDPGIGLTLDRGCTDGGPYTLDDRPTASTTVTGFGLAAFCIAAERGWMPRAVAAAHVRAAVRFFAEQAQHEHGWFYHWLHLHTGKRAGAFAVGSQLSEVSTIDTAFLLGGILIARQYFKDDPSIVGYADTIYQRVDFPWMLQAKKPILCHGWTPERGFIISVWDEYSEASLLYLLGIGSPTHPITPRSWYAWERNPNVYGPYKYIGTTPLFTMQYSHVFVDFRGRKEDGGKGVDWFENSCVATRAHRQFCMDLHKKFPGYTSTIWGITASRSVMGYTDWGGPPMDPRIDGTVVPAAPGGSLMFTPDICVPALRDMDACYGDKISCRYGFTDSFNPNTGWVSPDVTGLNLGITMLAAENLRSGNLWRWFMANPEAGRALDLAGIVKVQRVALNALGGPATSFSALEATHSTI